MKSIKIRCLRLIISRAAPLPDSETFVPEFELNYPQFHIDFPSEHLSQTSELWSFLDSLSDYDENDSDENSDHNQLLKRREPKTNSTFVNPLHEALRHPWID